MFQSFSDQSEGARGAERVAALREAMRIEGLGGFLVPLADAHQGEYVAPCDARLAWLTGFTGSAGFAVILPDRAAIFVDGRYRVQVRQQVDLAAFTPVDWPETKLADWLADNMEASAVLGLDPWLHSVRELEELRAMKGPELRFTANLVDRIWADRPAPPRQPVSIQPLEFAGKSHDEKRAELAATLRAAGQRAAVITLTDSTCWLLNIRGTDIPRNPIVQAFSVLHDDGSVDLCCDAPLDADLHAHLGEAVRIHAKSALLDLAKAISGPVRIDKTSAPIALHKALKEPVLGSDICALPKACKNEAELAGARKAHLRDGAAMVRFLAWMDGQVPGSLTEIDAVRQLETFRREGGKLRDISFDSIAGAGPNGAIVHYRVTETSNRQLGAGELFLIDSGGQYQDGTTDITRTLPIGAAGDEEQHCYTRVLQGLIAIHRIRFPSGTSGSQLDALARAPLWRDGMDYAHGTGHGVGSYLCVHEGPQRISSVSNVALSAGMILSNEPGYYREGAFGIRLENLIAVRADVEGWFGFETLTWVPFDRRLIETGLLSAEERDWLNTYHAEVLARIGPRLDAADRDWLEAACAAI